MSPRELRGLVQAATPLQTVAAAKSREPRGETAPAGLNDLMASTVLAGGLIVGGFFGVFGAWAATAPLHGAVVANGIVKVDGNRKSIQHLDGGIVRELRVKEGSAVGAGETLIILDDNQPRAEFEVLSQQLLVLRASEERLKTELNRRTLMMLPEDLKPYWGQQALTEIWSGQVHQFNTRRVALEGQRQVITEKIAQLEWQIIGGQAQGKALRAQLESVKAEMESLKPLLEKGLIARPKYLQLERSAAAFEGQTAEADATIAKSRQAIAEQQLQIAQLDNDRMTEIARDLRDVQAKLLEVIPRLTNARAVLSRVEIRSPYKGRVVGLSVFSVGAVINRGEKILDLVPEQEELIVEAQIGVDEINDVHPDMKTEIHLTAFKQRVTPVVHGTVLQVSADRLTDSRTGNAYYTALVRVDDRELAELPQVRLYPGMPAVVMIQTVKRTALDYLLGPLTMSFEKAFRQR